MRNLFAIVLSLTLCGSLLGQARRVDDASLKNAAKSAYGWRLAELRPHARRNAF